jgi:hypothetical protein
VFAGREEDTEPKGMGPDMTIAVLSGSPPSREYRSCSVQSSLTWGYVGVVCGPWEVAWSCFDDEDADVNVVAMIDIFRQSCVALRELSWMFHRTG